MWTWVTNDAHVKVNYDITILKADVGWIDQDACLYNIFRLKDLNILPVKVYENRKVICLARYLF